MSWQQFVKDYLTFTRKERIGLLVLTFFILFVILLPTFIKNNRHNQYAVTDTAWIASAKRVEKKESQPGERKKFNADGDNYVYQYDRPVNNPGSVLFNFDPNTLDEKGWKRLGLKDKTIHTIQNYLNKGGHFYKAEDLKRIYGLHPDDYIKLEPYVSIENSKASSNDKPIEYAAKEPGVKQPSFNGIDINTADTTAFISLPGIGAKLATRIINFRDKLGGFYSVNQIGETYGLADSVFQKIKLYFALGNVSVKKININTATAEELKAHPYIRYAIASSIISYRNEHGPFPRIEDIKKVMAVTDEVYNRIEPYLTLQ